MNDDARGADMMAEDGYREFCHFLERAAGIGLDERKKYLVESRLRGLIAEAGGSLEALLRNLQADRDPGLGARVVEAMTTHETSWFRDKYPFEYLGTAILPELAARGEAVRIWSAACAGGQEPYSISMVASELGGRPRLEVLATDISRPVLARAREATYTESELGRGLSAERRARFFCRAGDRWRVCDEVRARVRFCELNLLASFTALPRFDVVFCRNVLIYFTAQARRDVLQRLAAQLRAGGYLVLGGAEPLGVELPQLETVRAAGGVVYRKRSGSQSCRDAA